MPCSVTWSLLSSERGGELRWQLQSILYLNGILLRLDVVMSVGTENQRHSLSTSTPGKMVRIGPETDLQAL